MSWEGTGWSRPWPIAQGAAGGLVDRSPVSVPAPVSPPRSSRSTALLTILSRPAAPFGGLVLPPPGLWDALVDHAGRAGPCSDRLRSRTSGPVPSRLPLLPARRRSRRPRRLRAGGQAPGASRPHRRSHRLLPARRRSRRHRRLAAGGRLLSKLAASTRPSTSTSTPPQPATPTPCRRAARAPEGAGRIDEAIALYQHAAAAGDTAPCGGRPGSWSKPAASTRPSPCYQHAAESRRPRRLAASGRLLEQAGRIDEAIDWLQTRAASRRPPTPCGGRPGSWSKPAASTRPSTWYADPRREPATPTPCGKRPGSWSKPAASTRPSTGMQTRAAAGDRDRPGQAARLLEQAGRIDEAIDFTSAPPKPATLTPCGEAARFLERAGRIDEAIDSTSAPPARPPHGLVAGGRAPASKLAAVDEAIALYQRAAAAGDPTPCGGRPGSCSEPAASTRPSTSTARCRGRRPRRPGRMRPGYLEQAGRIDEAIDWLQTRAAETGDPIALGESGRAPGAGRPHRRGHRLVAGPPPQTGDTAALGRAAALLERAGRIDEAIGWLQGRAAAGDAAPCCGRPRSWSEPGRIDEAIDWLQTPAAETGDTALLRWAAELWSEPAASTRPSPSTNAPPQLATPMPCGRRPALNGSRPQRRGCAASSVWA